MTSDDLEAMDWADLDDEDGTGDLAELANGFTADDGDWGDPDAGDVEEVVGELSAPNMARGMRNDLTNMAVRPTDPSELGYPPTLPVEIALQTAPMEDIREAYGFNPGQWRRLQDTEQFKNDVATARSMLKEDGMSFKAKARLQAEELLKTSWGLIHDKSGMVPPSVKADLLKFTIRAAGLEASPKDQLANITPLQININM